MPEGKLPPHNIEILVACPSCGTVRTTRKGREGLICRQCYYKTRRGAAHPNWKGGRYISDDGRVFLLTPHRGYVQRSRLVMEAVLGRQLLSHEDAHHLNGIKHDDRPENLQVMTHGEHTALTNRQQCKARRMQEFRWAK
jgi:hypothetical protein